MAKLTKEDIKHTAELARIKLSDSEIEKYTKELGSVLGYVEILNEVDTKDVEDTAQVTNLENRLRVDKVEKSLERKEALSNAKDTEDGFLLTER